jgi:hypothetical protein
MPSTVSIWVALFLCLVIISLSVAMEIFTRRARSFRKRVERFIGERSQVLHGHTPDLNLERLIADERPELQELARAMVYEGYMPRMTIEGVPRTEVIHIADVVGRFFEDRRAAR